MESLICASLYSRYCKQLTGQNSQVLHPHGVSIVVGEFSNHVEDISAKGRRLCRQGLRRGHTGTTAAGKELEEVREGARQISGAASVQRLRGPCLPCDWSGKVE